MSGWWLQVPTGEGGGLLAGLLACRGDGLHGRCRGVSLFCQSGGLVDLDGSRRVQACKADVRRRRLC